MGGAYVLTGALVSFGSFCRRQIDKIIDFCASGDIADDQKKKEKEKKKKKKKKKPKTIGASSSLSTNLKSIIFFPFVLSASSFIYIVTSERTICRTDSVIALNKIN